MRFAIETWSPDYGAPADDAALEASDVAVDASPEQPIGSWAPVAPSTGEPIGAVVFVDGVQRVEANIWVTDPDGTLHHGCCASYGAGAVRCDGRAEVVAAQVRRAVFSPSAHASAIDATAGRFEHHRTPSDEPGPVAGQLGAAIARLEAEVAASAGQGGDLVVVDGPLRSGHDRADLVGYIKTHARAYGPDEVRATVGALAVGERTPVLLVQGVRPRWSWYQRLPVEPRHGWAGVVRLEHWADGPLADATALADRLASGLGRFASVTQKDPRAPQNLYPIGGLERELRRRLGDPGVIFRSLAVAAHR